MRLLVIGAGQMGAGIAQVAAEAGDEVVLFDRAAEYVDRGLAAIDKNQARAVEKERMTLAERDAARARIATATEWRDFAVDVAIEAASERLETKLELFRLLDAHTPPEAVLASNTSSISITKLGAATRRAELVIGMHYMNPVPVMKLVEVIRGVATSAATFEATVALARRQGKTPVDVRNAPGFVSNRILCPMLNEAIFALGEGIGSVESIDTVMKLGMNHPMGPLELADFIGLDTVLSIMNVLCDGYRDSKYRPAPLLVEYVEAGWLGKKSGRGFYDYASGTRTAR